MTLPKQVIISAQHVKCDRQKEQGEMIAIFQSTADSTESITHVKPCPSRPSAYENLISLSKAAPNLSKKKKTIHQHFTLQTVIHLEDTRNKVNEAVTKKTFRWCSYIWNPLNSRISTVFQSE